MGYKLASAARVEAALANVLRRTPSVASQTELVRLVREHLSEVDPQLRVSGVRLRQVALRSGRVRLRVATRRSRRPLPEACPVCRAPLRHLENRTLNGGSTIVGASCADCPYRSGPSLDQPTRYLFEARRPGPPPPDEEEIE